MTLNPAVFILATMQSWTNTIAALALALTLGACIESGVTVPSGGATDAVIDTGTDPFVPPWEKDAGSTAGPPDATASDTAQDTGTEGEDGGDGGGGSEDTGSDVSCGPCPTDRPLCIEGTCACDAASCPGGTFCNDAICAPCTTDSHCGNGCENCNDLGEFCKTDGTGCTGCDLETPCPAGAACVGVECVPCDTAERCGLSCAPCGPGAPVCIDGACGCDDASCGCDDSTCPVGTACEGGACTPCESDARCGFSCKDCTLTGTPVCDNGQCVCTADAQCGAGKWCAGGACLPCGNGDPDHCGATCAVCGGTTPVCKDGLCACANAGDCGDAFECIQGGCQPCNTPTKCGPACLPCGGTTPGCDGAQCVCTDASCPASTFCDGVSCQPCTASDASHCGPSCAVCAGTSTPVCEGGTCVCTTFDQCGKGHFCSGGACQTCGMDDPDHCGPSCADCGPQTPVCQAGTCACTNASCHAGSVCEAGVCTPCKTDAACGPGCTPCAAPTPYCKADGSGCAVCATDAQCPSGLSCVNGACTLPCAPSCCAGDGSPTAKKCSSAILVGRMQAKPGAYYSGDTTDDGDNDDLGTNTTKCWDGNDDNFYRIWVLQGETLKADLSPLEWEFDAMLKLYEGTTCEGDGDDDLIGCYHSGGDGEKESFTYTATKSGWYTIVVDGRMAFYDDYDWGAYNLVVTLTCNSADCGCQ